MRVPKPKIGTFWAVTPERKREGVRIWQVVGQESGGFCMRLVGGDCEFPYRIGQTMWIERDWFTVRGSLPKDRPGAVRIMKEIQPITG